ncbi:MAG: acyl-CoA synthetase [Verrucomicrobia bacterium]|nr:MAG: acyl-CoA synthetase [Verrucomicrobiota bacterium]
MTAPLFFNFARDVMDRWARERPDSPALWCVGESGPARTKLSFKELSDHYRRAASFFDELGIQRGDRVLIVLPRVPEWWITVLGLIRLGVVPIPGTPMLTARDIRYRREAADACALITDSEGVAKAEGIEFRHRIIVGEERPGWVSFAAAIRAADRSFNPPPTRSDDPGLIYFTSGTTGHPKMVLHTQASYGLGHRNTGEFWLDLKPDDVHWCITDTGWAKAAWSCLFGPWQMGACVFAVDSRGKFDAAAALHILAENPITTWCAPPTALRLIVREDLRRYRFPVLRHCVSAGEPLNPEVLAAWKAATGLTIYDGYGQTETTVLIANSRRRGDAVHPGSMGKPSPAYTVALLGDDLREVPVGEEGEIAVQVKPQRPVGLFREYWQNPEENALRFQGDWYLTGDRARRDEQGYYWFVGRGDDVIKSASYRIGPFEVESALLEHPEVVEAAVVAKPDAIRGQIVKAFVVVRHESAACDQLKAQLQEHCKRVTAPYKYPREIEFVPELPKTISGKIRRVQLRALCEGDKADRAAA